MSSLNIDSLIKFSLSLDENERDNLKYKLFLLAMNEYNNQEVKNDEIFISGNTNISKLLECLVKIQPYSNRIKDYGLAYKGRPSFMTDEVLNSLIIESEKFKSQARPNFNQHIYQVETLNDSTKSETFANSKDLLDLVNASAGFVSPSYITSYIYYLNEGDDSKPHVDNAFTSITVMVGLKHDYPKGLQNNRSSSFIFWPNKKPLYYQLQPGEIAIFYGSSVIHGRTPIGKEESINSLLVSFRPKL